MSRIDDAIQESLADNSRIVTEWVLFACTQSYEDGDAEGGYIAAFRPGMMPHHITGLVDHGIELLDSAQTEVGD